MIHRRKFFISLGLVFIAGIVVGIAIGSFMGERRFADRFRKGPQKETIVNVLAIELNLSAEQKASLAVQIEAQFKKMDAFRNETRNKMQEFKNETILGIVPALSAEQKKLFDEFEKHHMPPPPGSDKGGMRPPPPPF